MNKVLTIAATAFVVAVVALPASGSLARSTAGSQTYTDATGDSADAADIASLTVANDDAGLVTFTFTYANRALGLTSHDFLFLYLNTDGRQTGDPTSGGFDYLIVFTATEQAAGLLKWQNNDFVDTPQTTFRATPDGRQLQVNRRELGNTSAFHFIAITAREDAEGTTYAFDNLPNAGRGPTYQLVLPQIRSVAPRFSPSTPRAGRRFSAPGATVRLTNGQNVAPSAVTCTARLAGRALRPVGRCAWRIPANATGKRLVVTVTATYQGMRRTAAPRAFRVR